MKIAIVGTRGIPAAYGGFETLAWELSTRLAARGHDVTVYCRRGRTDESIPVPAGIRRRFLPYLPGKYPSHREPHRPRACSTRSSAATTRSGSAMRPTRSSPACRGSAARWSRSTWTGSSASGRSGALAGRAWYAVGERFALVFPNAIVSDAKVIQDYYLDRYGSRSTLIAYGAPILERDPPPDLAAHGLAGIEPGRYVLYVSRLEPENQADLVVARVPRVPGDIPLLIVGDAPHAEAFKARLASSRRPTRGSA